MAFAYITPDNLKKQWQDSEKSMLAVFDPLKEYERIARNRPHPGIDKAYPKVTDGTLAAIIQETPKRYIQQLPTGVVKTNIGEWFDVFATWKLLEDIIPHANCQADPLQKSWRAGSNSLAYGASHGYVYMDNTTDYVGANFKIPYITHVYLQKGKISTRESKVLFLESWYQEVDIDYIIDREKTLKKEDPEYKTEWDIKELEDIKKMRQAKAEDQKTPHERSDNKNSETDTDGIRIIHAMQQGIGAKFYSFVESVKGEGVRIVRTKVNPDPRGVIPVHTLYCNIDLSNPLGRGIVEISGGMQNLVDSMTQGFQYMQNLMMAPPIVTRGDVPRGSVKYVPNAVIKLGSNPNNSVEPLKIETSAHTNFPTNYGLMKSQILNLNSSQDTSVSGESGNPSFSKTQAGVKAQESRLGVSDNYLRKQYETWWQDICETMLNLTFAETNGARIEYLDKKTADKLRQLIPEGNEVIIWDAENENNIIVNYDELGKEPIYFVVDASTSQVKEDQAQVDALSVAKELVIDMLPPSKRMLFANKFVNKLGLEDPEDVTFTEQEIAQAAQMEQMQGGMQPQQEFTEEELMFAQGLQERGYPPEVVDQAVVMLQQGMQDEEILAVLGGANV